MLFTIFLLFTTFLQGFCVDGIEKRYRLKILNLVNDGADGAYRSIARLAMDAANNRSDLLPDYHVVMQFEDEGYAALAVQKVISFTRSEDDTGGYLSPIIIGPQYSTGCKAIGLFLGYVNMVSQSSSCGAPVIENHSLYHNLYLMVQTSQYTGLALLRFMREVGWNRFALLTYDGSVNDLGGALEMHRMAMKHDFSVTWFSMIVTLEETEEVVKLLKASNPRVIVIFTGTDTVLYTFLCAAYRLGLTGPRYQFIAIYAASAEPFEMTDHSYPGCTLTAIFKQLKQTLWAGQALNIRDKSIKSQFGHSQTTFDSLIQDMSASKRPHDDPYRFAYYDAHVKALYALHDTEEKLRRLNLSLRDYGRFPELVMKVANSSLLAVNVTGLHIKRMTYDKAGLPEFEGQAIGEWSFEGGHETVAIGYQLRAKSVYNFDSYFIKMVRNISWNTVNGKPPRDHETVMRVTRVVPTGAFVSVTLISGLLILLQSIIFGVLWKKICNDVPISQSIAYLGCTLLDLAAICYVGGNFSLLEESRRTTAIVLLTTGVSFINGISANRGAFTSLSHPTRVENRRMRTPSRGTHTAVTFGWKNSDKIVSVGGCFFALLNATIVICWFTIDPIKCTLELFGDPVYQNEEDVLIETMMERCVSKEMIAWPFGTIFLHLILLLAGGLFAYSARKKKRYSYSGFVFLGFGLANSATLLFCILFIVGVVKDAINQQIALAFVALLLSALTWLSLLLFGLSVAADNQVNRDTSIAMTPISATPLSAFFHRLTHWRGHQPSPDE